jgi:hypothetical protein
LSAGASLVPSPVTAIVSMSSPRARNAFTAYDVVVKNNNKQTHEKISLGWELGEEQNNEGGVSMSSQRARTPPQPDRRLPVQQGHVRQLRGRTHTSLHNQDTGTVQHDVDTNYHARNACKGLRAGGAVGRRW